MANASNAVLFFRASITPAETYSLKALFLYFLKAAFVLKFNGWCKWVIFFGTTTDSIWTFDNLSITLALDWTLNASANKRLEPLAKLFLLSPFPCKGPKHHWLDELIPMVFVEGQAESKFAILERFFYFPGIYELEWKNYPIKGFTNCHDYGSFIGCHESWESSPWAARVMLSVTIYDQFVRDIVLEDFLGNFMRELRPHVIPQRLGNNCSRCCNFSTWKLPSSISWSNIRWTYLKLNLTVKPFRICTK